MLDQVFRDDWLRVLASLVGFLGDSDLAQEAGWPISTVRRRAIDRILAAIAELHLDNLGTVDPRPGSHFCAGSSLTTTAANPPGPPTTLGSR